MTQQGGTFRQADCAYRGHVGMALPRVPYAVRMLETENNDRRFLSPVVLAWLVQQGIQVMRSRPYKKNHNAHVEQQDGTDVRGVVGIGASLQKKTVRCFIGCRSWFICV